MTYTLVKYGPNEDDTIIQQVALPKEIGEILWNELVDNCYVDCFEIANDWFLERTACN